MATGRLPDPNTAPVTAKGDLYTYSTVPAKLAVGNNGETLVADSSTSTGLRWQTGFNNNGSINGGFDIWQRGTSFTDTNSTSAYCADRWTPYSARTGGTISRQTASLDGFQYCLRFQRNSGNTATGDFYLMQPLETSESLKYAGQTVTMSFYARAGANYSAASNGLIAQIRTGTGTDQNPWAGYTGSSTIVSQTKTLTTSWQRFTVTGAVGTTATELSLWFAFTPTGTAGANDYFEVTGVQLEIGSVPTTFKRAGGTLAGELAACQRYYYDHSTGNNLTLGVGFYFSSSDVRLYVKFPVTMRTTPTVVATSGTNYYCVSSNGADDFINSLIIARGAASGCLVYNNSEAAGTSGYAGEFRNANASASLAFNAEL